MPSRKRAKKNPPAEPPNVIEPQQLPEPSSQLENSAEASTDPAVPKDGPSANNTEDTNNEANAVEESSSNAADSIVTAGGTDTPRSTRSWYGGTWPRTPKAAPVPQVVKGGIDPTGDTIAKAAAKTLALKDSPKPSLRAPSLLSPSTRSLPVIATTTNLTISSGASGPSDDGKMSIYSKDKQTPVKPAVRPYSTPPESETTAKAEEAVTPANLDKPERTKQGGAKAQPKATEQQAQNQAMWLGWFGNNETKKHGPPQSGLEVPASKPTKAVEHVNVVGNTSTEAVGDSKVAESVERKDKDSTDQRRNSDPNPKHSNDIQEESVVPTRSSWLGLWGGSQSRPVKKPASLESCGTIADASMRSSESLPLGKVAERLDPAESELTRKPKGVSDGNDSSSGWAFWSRASDNTSKEDISTKKDVGQLAVAGSSTESRPEDAFVGSKGVPTAAGTATGKRAMPTSAGTQRENRSAKAKGPPRAAVTDSGGNTSVGVSGSDKFSAPRPTSKKDSTENLLLPLFKQTYATEPDRLSLLQQIGRLFYGKAPPARHPTLIKDPPRMKKALAIGVHGYFPMPIIQTVLGRPTGTSIKFAESAANAIHRFTQEQGYTLKSVEKIALEGEGKIEERLDLLWKLLLNWIDTIREADFILVACHSQGVPVAISLVAKLIGFGCVNGAKIGICAMAGVNLGPFADYKSRWIGGSAGELFEFARPDSQVSKGYETALDTVLRFGAKVIYVGSLDDQLVSLHSSTFGIVQHPNIYRAVWIDGRMHVPDFLTHLVGFALKLRNLGVSDHGLIRELSNPLAGSLVGGEGHSRIYEDSAVYDLAVEFVMETTSLGSDMLKVDKPSQLAAQNPYVLPFAMRGLLEEDFVRKELSGETLDLLMQFDDWKPTTKVLRDVKYRLEGIRSKL